MTDVSILDPAVHAAPKNYAVAGAQEIILKGVTASFDGSGAAAAWTPAVQIVDPSGAVVGTYTLGQSLAAGASADVSWFPGVGAGSSGSGAGGGGLPVRVPLDTPDAGGFAVPGLSTSFGFTTVRRLLPFLRHGGTGYWTGAIRVPDDYGSAPTVTITWVAAVIVGAVRLNVASSVIAVGASEDPAYTSETAQNVTVPGTALLRKDTTFVLSTVPVAGSDLNVKVSREGGNVADTCTGQAFILQVVFDYTPA